MNIQRTLSPTPSPTPTSPVASSPLDAIPVQSTPPAQVLAQADSLQTQIQDTLTLNGGEGNAPTQELSEQVAAFKNMMGTGPGTSLENDFQNFVSRRLPEIQQELAEQENTLKTQIQNLPEGSPERVALELQLQSVERTQALYQRFESLVAQAGLEPEPLTVPEPDFAGVAQTADLSADFSRAGYTNYVGGRNNRPPPYSEPGLFTQRAESLNAQSQALDTQISELRSAGATQEQLEPLIKAKALVDSLADLYGQLDQSRTPFRTDPERDLRAVIAKIGEVENALAQVGDAIPAEEKATIEASLDNFKKLIPAYTQSGGTIEHTFGRFVARTFAKLDEIQSGRRTRETPDIEGALQSYANDREDLKVFLERFEALQTGIRNGSIPLDEARSRALAAIPGTSAAFQEEYLRLVGIEVDLKTAEIKTEQAQEANASANAYADQADASIEQGDQASGNSARANRGAVTALREQDLEASRAASGIARDERDRADGHYADAEGFTASAESEAQRARGLTQEATRHKSRADTNIGLSSITDFDPGYGGVLTGQSALSAQVGAQIDSAVSAIDATDDRTAELRDTLSDRQERLGVLDNALNLTTVAQDKVEEHLKAIQAENQLESERVSSATANGAESFEATFGVSLVAGEDLGGLGSAELRARVFIGLSGERDDDGSYTFSLKLGVEAKAKLESWFLEAEASTKFEWSKGIKFESQEDIEAFTGMLDNMLSTIGEKGLNSPEARAARDRLLNFASERQVTTRTWTNTGKLTVGDESIKTSVVSKEETYRDQTTFTDKSSFELEIGGYKGEVSISEKRSQRDQVSPDSRTFALGLEGALPSPSALNSLLEGAGSPPLSAEDYAEIEATSSSQLESIRDTKGVLELTRKANGELTYEVKFEETSGFKQDGIPLAKSVGLTAEADFEIKHVSSDTVAEGTLREASNETITA